ncbi:MAG: DUF3482 domain-containing protein [Rubrivivax sp.]|nr:DUF3482 domain-containing protein [Rubrivivax sp.]
MTRIALSLVSHTNVGKTTLARTLLGRDVGEVRDAPHVTAFAEPFELLRSEEGHLLTLWDTPGFGDSARLLRRLRQSANPIGWFLGQVWDRWRDRPFWASQQVLRHVRDTSDLLLYLVNAAEGPQAAGYVAAEMELLDWVGKPVIVLLNQMGPPRDAAAEAAEAAPWQQLLQRWPRVHAVLPLDAFARCWVQEGALWAAVQAALPEAAQRAAMASLRAAWMAERQRQFDTSMRTLGQALQALAGLQEPVPDDPGTLRQLGAKLGLGGPPPDAVAAARERLAARLGDGLREATQALLALHGLPGTATAVVLQRVAALGQARLRVDSGRAAGWGAVLSGALGGLAADLAAGGLTLGVGVLAGAMLGAAGGVGAAEGLNRLRGTDRSVVALDGEARRALLQTALLRYLAVAHFGRGRGDWAEAEALPHWAALAEELTAGTPPGPDAEWPALLARCTRQALQRLYPGAGE